MRAASCLAIFPFLFLPFPQLLLVSHRASSQGTLINKHGARDITKSKTRSSPPSILAGIKLPRGGCNLVGTDWRRCSPRPPSPLSFPQHSFPPSCPPPLQLSILLTLVPLPHTRDLDLHTINGSHLSTGTMFTFLTVWEGWTRVPKCQNYTRVSLTRPPRRALLNQGESPLMSGFLSCPALWCMAVVEAAGGDRAFPLLC